MKIKLVLFYFCVCLIFCEILAATKAKKALKVRLLLALHKATYIEQKRRFFLPLVILILLLWHGIMTRNKKVASEDFYFCCSHVKEGKIVLRCKSQ